MKTKPLGKIVSIIFIFFLLLGCNTDRKNNCDKDVELCKNLWKSYSMLLKEGNPDSIATKFTQNAIIVYPNIPDIVGKENILATLKSMFPNISMLEFDYEIKNLCVSDSTLSSFISVNEKYIDASNVEYNSDTRITTFWKLESDGEWRIELFHVNYKR